MARRTSKRHRSTPDPDAARVGNRIRTLRLAQGFTFDAWVETIGMGRGYASELERGLVNPSLAALLRVAEALGLPVADLLLGETARERLYEYLREWPEPRVEQLLHSLEAQHAPLSRAAEEASHYSPRAAPKKRR